jgi:recombinational DNA repair ATPase RecF
MENKMVLKLHNWKCFDTKSFEIPKTNFLILDENGNGKTSILSAIYSLFTGKAFPGTKFNQYLNFNKEYFGISTDRPDWFLTGKISPSGRIVTKHQLPAEKDFLGFGNEHKFTVLTYQPTDNYWLFQSRTSKLGILDQIISNSDSEYEKQILELNKLTKSKLELIKHSNSTQTIDWIMVETLSQRILDLSGIVWQKRLAFSVDFEKKIREFMGWINLEVKDWNIEWEMTNQIGKKIWIKKKFDWVKVETELGLKNIDFKKLWERECTIEKVMFGANRDDFMITSSYQKLETILSRGEMRLFVLFCKKINTENSNIIWLMDDIFNELDQKREAIILNEITNNAIWTISTGTQFNLESMPKFSVQDLTIQL